MGDCVCFCVCVRECLSVYEETNCCLSFVKKIFGVCRDFFKYRAKIPRPSQAIKFPSLHTKSGHNDLVWGISGEL